MLRQILATCDAGARGRRDRALLLFGFVGAPRRSELASLRVEDVGVVPSGLRLRIVRGKTDQAGQGRGPRSACRVGGTPRPAPVLAFAAWRAVAERKAGPLFRKISVADGIGDTALHPGAIRWILAHRMGMAGLTLDGFDRLSTHALRCHEATGIRPAGAADVCGNAGHGRRAKFVYEQPWIRRIFSAVGDS